MLAAIKVISDDYIKQRDDALAEADSLRQQLENALARQAEAGRRGGKTTDEIIAELKKQDLSKLISFLDGEIDRGEADLIELHRERAAACYLVGDIDKAIASYEKILALIPGDLDALNGLGHIAALRGDLGEAMRLYEQALQIYTQLGSLEGQAIALANMGIVAATSGEFDEARRLWTQSLELFRQVGMKPEVDWVQGLLDGLPPSDAGSG